MGQKAKPIRDTETGKEYPSMYNAGLHLWRLVGGDPADHYVWYKIVRRFPNRFETKDPDGDWVAVDYRGSRS